MAPPAPVGGGAGRRRALRSGEAVARACPPEQGDPADTRAQNPTPRGRPTIDTRKPRTDTGGPGPRRWSLLRGGPRFVRESVALAACACHRGCCLSRGESGGRFGFPYRVCGKRCCRRAWRCAGSATARFGGDGAGRSRAARGGSRCGARLESAPTSSRQRQAAGGGHAGWTIAAPPPRGSVAAPSKVGGLPGAGLALARTEGECLCGRSSHIVEDRRSARLAFERTGGEGTDEEPRPP